MRTQFVLQFCYLLLLHCYHAQINHSTQQYLNTKQTKNRGKLCTGLFALIESCEGQLLLALVQLLCLVPFSAFHFKVHSASPLWPFSSEPPPNTGAASKHSDAPVAARPETSHRDESRLGPRLLLLAVLSTHSQGRSSQESLCVLVWYIRERVKRERERYRPRLPVRDFHTPPRARVLSFSHLFLSYHIIRQIKSCLCVVASPCFV